MLKRLEILLKAAVMAGAGFLLRKGKSGFESVDLSKISRVLIIRPEKIGDLFVTLPIINALKKNAPHVKIGLLTSPDAFPLIQNDPRIDNIYLYRKNIRLDSEALFAMQDQEYDVVIDMVGRDSTISLFLSQLVSKRAVHLSLGKQKYRRYYDLNYDLVGDYTGHVITNTMKLLKGFGLDYDDADSFAPPALTLENMKYAENLLERIPQKGSLIGYNLSAGSPQRIWPDGKAKELLERILTENESARIILISVLQDRKRAEELKRLNNERIYLIPPGGTLLDAAAVIRNLDCLITPDTSLVHIGRAFHVPVVGLYLEFMENYKIWRPLGQNRGQLVSSSAESLDDIDVDEVFREYKALRGRTEKRIG